MRILLARVALLALFFGAFDAAVGISLSPSLKGGGGRGGSGGGRGGGGRGAGTGRGGSGNTGRPSVAPSGANGRKADYYSPGGGKRTTLSPPSVFAGREAGGATRAEVLGTRRYGSGYPYYSQDPRSHGVAGQPFPFGFWPIYWSGHGHSDEYGGNNSTVIGQRPGGNLTYIQLIPTASSGWNATAVNGVNETYWMIGDFESIVTLLSVLVDPPNNNTSPYGCNVTNVGPYTFNSDDASLPFHFENVLQWYRSSSFALAYQGYNDTYALSPLNETTSLEWNNTTPLPDQQLYSPFLRCINATITAALPILDAPSSKLSTGGIIGIVIGSIVGTTVILTFFCCWLGSNSSRGKEKKQRKERRVRDKREDIASRLTRIKSEYNKEIEEASRRNTIEFPTPPTKQVNSENALLAKETPTPYSVESGFSSGMESNIKHSQIAMPEPRQV